MRKTRRGILRRRLLLVLPFIALVAGLLVFFLASVLASTDANPVPRAETPLAASLPNPPAAAEADGKTSSGGRPEEGRPKKGRPNGATKATKAEPANNRMGISGAEGKALRKELEAIAEAYPGRYGVIVSDPSSGETVSMDSDERFLAASINKLPVLMTLYKSAAKGTVNLDDSITMRASDIQAYGTGSLQLEPVGTTMTLRECATYLIKESDNTAWKMLDRYLGRDHIRSELYGAGATSTEYWIPNTTTPTDVLVMLEKISDPSYTSPELSAEMLALMTNTDFEDRLPQPLPKNTKVSHKIGSYGATFGDAGLVFPPGSDDPQDAYYIAVLVDETGEGPARAAMQKMSLASYRAFTRDGP